MPDENTPTEPANLVLELLRQLRGEMLAFRSELADMRSEMATKTDIAELNAKLDQEIGQVKTELRGMKLQTIAEIYKANLTVASFAELSARVDAIERKLLA